MKILLVAALALLPFAAAFPIDQSHVIVGDAAAHEQLSLYPTLEPAMLETVSYAGIKKTNENEQLLARMELLAQQMGAKVVADDTMALADKEASKIEAELSSESVERMDDPVDHLLAEVEAQTQHEVQQELSGEAELADQHSNEANAEALSPEEINASLHPTALIQQESVDLSLPTSLLNSAPVHDAAADEDSQLEQELNMVELDSTISQQPPRQNNYLFIDDPKNGGATPAVLSNLKGLDIYVVNTPVRDAENEIRPVKPPHPKSHRLRQRLAREEALRKSLIHEVPQPKASVHPAEKINTLSAYESSLVSTEPEKFATPDESRLNNPVAGNQGALAPAAHPLPAVNAHSFMEHSSDALTDHAPRTSLPGFPTNEPAAAKEKTASEMENASSFDLSDGPPQFLDDLLPHKAEMVETLTPPVVQPSKPNW